MGYPVSTAKDIIENPQLRAREVWQKVEHSGLGATITYPGPWAEMEHPEIGKYHLELPAFKLSKVPPQLRMSGPLIGEHNEYVYKNLAGFSQKEYEQLQKEGVFD